VSDVLFSPSPSLRQAFDEALRAVPDGKRGRAGAIVTPDGIRFDIGYRPRTWLDISGAASRTWKAGTWTGGARVGVTW
jgi:hypothetical protein